MRLASASSACESTGARQPSRGALKISDANDDFLGWERSIAHGKALYQDDMGLVDDRDSRLYISYILRTTTSVRDALNNLDVLVERPETSDCLLNPAEQKPA
jgi:hypothetical protein